MAVHVTEHRCQRVRCPDCGARPRGELPPGTGAGAFGPRFHAAVAVLSIRNRISRGDVVELCEQLFGSRISSGTIDAILESVADALEDPNWAAVGGQDVPALLGRLGDQVRMLHLKDGPINTDSAEQLPLGSGAMPVPDILTAATAVETAVLEFDDYAGDVFEGIATGYGYVTGLAHR